MVAIARTAEAGAVSSARLDDAVKQLRKAASPLLQTIDFRR